MKTKIIWTFPDGSWRKISCPNIQGKVITSVKAIDDGQWYIWHDFYYDRECWRKKFGL